MYHHMYTQPPRPSEINAEIHPDIDQLILALLEKEMDKRIKRRQRQLIKPLRARFS